MNNRKLIIPAAGEGTRLNSEAPKIFTLINESETIFDRILPEAGDFFDEIALILSPDGERYLNEKMGSIPSNIEIFIQKSPTGMFDALDLAIDENVLKEKHHKIFIQWGDQPFIDSRIYKSLSDDLDQYDASIPLIWIHKPYVQFRFQENHLTILESREGDQCDRYGFKDMGLFAFDKERLLNTWSYYRGIEQQGSKTKEKSFLQIIPRFLKSGTISWRVDQPTYKALGINTGEELDEAKFLLDQMRCIGLE